MSRVAQRVLNAAAAAVTNSPTRRLPAPPTPNAPAGTYSLSTPLSTPLSTRSRYPRVAACSTRRLLREYPRVPAGDPRETSDAETSGAGTPGRFRAFALCSGPPVVALFWFRRSALFVCLCVCSCRVWCTTRSTITENGDSQGTHGVLTEPQGCAKRYSKKCAKGTQRSAPRALTVS